MRYFLVLVLAALPVNAQEVNAERARFNYQMSCQGCHTYDGSGVKAVPRMRDFVGLFLRSQAGREFLVRVPGSATSALGDNALAEVLNWILLEFAGVSAEADFQRYTADEVAALRQFPLFEVDRYRAGILLNIFNNEMEVKP